MADFDVKDDTVNVWGLEREMQPVLKNASAIWRKYGQKLVITSARDGMHSGGSLHYYGLAVDMRTRYFDPIVLKEVVEELEAALGEDYDVIVHKTHMHVEYDPD